MNSQFNDSGNKISKPLVEIITLKFLLRDGRGLGLPRDWIRRDWFKTEKDLKVSPEGLDAINRD